MDDTYIKSHEFVRGIGSTPARVNRKTGHLQINADLWPFIKPEHKIFILLHEEGHVALNTSDELAVDKYAFDKYAAMGYSLTESVKALTQILNAKNPEHVMRANNQLQRALRYDNQHYKNVRAFRPSYTEVTRAGQLSSNPVMAGIQTANEFDGLFGGKKAKAAKAEKKAFKTEKKRTKLEMKKSKVEARNANRAGRIENKRIKAEGHAEQDAILAEQGITRGGQIAEGVGNAVQGVAGALGGILGAKAAVVGGVLGGGDDAAPEVSGTYSSAGAAGAPVKSKTTMYIVISVVVLAVIVTAFVLLKKKKK